MVEHKTVSKETIIRTIILILALVNSILTSKGKSMLPISDEEVSEVVSWIFTTAASLWAWWKNNSFTQAALRADEIMKEEKKNK